jgi:CNT family concentrative nucleoside transporter
MERLVSLLGLVVILSLAWLLSENRRRISVRLVVSGLALQLALALVFLRTPAGEWAFAGFRAMVSRLLSFSDAGARFFFGEAFLEKNMFFSVMPTIIFVASATAVLFHLGVIQWVVRGMARAMQWVMDTSGTESLAAAAEVFVGMTESPLVIRPYLETMTRSEIVAMMTAGMGTVAGGVMAAYVQMGVDAGHLMAASLMAAPASLVIAKIMVPETEESPTKGRVRIEIPRPDVNVFDAACRGAAEGLRLALNVGAMLIAFVALVACVNWLLSLCGLVGGEPLSLERILGWLFRPLAWTMGVAWEDTQTVGMLLGKKTVLNEYLAYQDLVALRGGDTALAPRSELIATYALCGFANFGSIAVQIGGVSGLAPSRRALFAKYGLRAMIGGALATFLTATIAGLLL